MTTNHWNTHARQWDRIGSPLRPLPDDIRIMESFIWSGHDAAADGTEPLAMLLGVTPEIVAMRWPPGTTLLAVDHAIGMIHGVWPGQSRRRSHAVCADWRRLPTEDAHFQFVVGDGSFTLFRYLDGWRDASASLHRALTPGGLLVARFFCFPHRAETPGQVFDALLGGRIGSYHAFKWRLAMALQVSSAEGVEVGRIFEAWRDARIDAGALAARFGWRRDVMDTISAYRGASARYTFPTIEEVRGIFADDFEELGYRHGDYELAERCPIIAFRPRGET